MTHIVKTIELGPGILQCQLIDAKGLYGTLCVLGAGVHFMGEKQQHEAQATACKMLAVQSWGDCQPIAEIAHNAGLIPVVTPVM